MRAALLITVTTLGLFMGFSESSGAYDKITVEQPVVLSLRSQAVVESDDVFLANVATCTGKGCHEILGMRLQTAPAAGSEQTVDHVTVLNEVHREFPNRYILIEGAERVSIIASKFALTEHDALAQVQAQFQYINDKWKSLRLNVKRIRLLKPITVRQEGAKIFLPSLMMNPDQVVQSVIDASPGWLQTAVEVRDGGMTNSFQVMIQIEIQKRVSVVARGLQAGQVIVANDLEERWDRVTRLNASMYPEEEAIVGRAARRALMAGSAIKSADLSEPVVIAKGQKVKVSLSKGDVSVVVDGVAQSSGIKGAKIEVAYGSKKSKISGIVIDGQNVQGAM
jgi:flagella basal body P-ring formation protein FlgA